jgi:hypothetical protein
MCKKSQPISVLYIKDKTGFDYKIGVEQDVNDFLFDDIPFINKILSSTNFHFNTTSSTYEILGRTTYNYNSTLSVENFGLVNKIKLFPNPAT